MSVIAVHDYDFFKYQSVIPNLECAKLIAYHRAHHNIAILTPEIDPSKYSKVYIRKEYDDGQFPPIFFNERCEYGGRAFTARVY